MKILRIVVGLVVGGVTGATLGILVAAAIGWISQVSHPEDPSAGSVAIIVIATAPLGCLVGAAIGVSLAVRRNQKP